MSRAQRGCCIPPRSSCVRPLNSCAFARLKIGRLQNNLDERIGSWTIDIPSPLLCMYRFLSLTMGSILIHHAPLAFLDRFFLELQHNEGTPARIFSVDVNTFNDKGEVMNSLWSPFPRVRYCSTIIFCCLLVTTSTLWKAARMGGGSRASAAVQYDQ